MTTTDWIIDIALLAIVFRQIRESRVDLMFVLIPLGLVSYFAAKYLHGLPTAGNDLVLVGGLVAMGAILGISGGLVTKLRFDGKHALIKAGWTAVILWVLGMGSRMAFQLYASHGGGESIAKFSAHHDITSEQAWATAFVLMAFTEVATRVATLLIRSFLVKRQQPVAPVKTLVAA